MHSDISRAKAAFWMLPLQVVPPMSLSCRNESHAHVLRCYLYSCADFTSSINPDFFPGDIQASGFQLQSFLSRPTSPWAVTSTSVAAMVRRTAPLRHPSRDSPPHRILPKTLTFLPSLLRSKPCFCPLLQARHPCMRRTGHRSCTLQGCCWQRVRFLLRINFLATTTISRLFIPFNCN